MRVGISPFGSSRESALQLAAAAAAGGMDTLWLGDGYLANPDFDGWSGGMESFVELAWLAGRVPTARVGISAAVLPLRDPSWLAKQANTLAQVADGGFVLVVTPGFWERDLAARGIAFDERGRHFEAALDQLLAALDDRGLSPGAPADGPPPVWLAGGAATMRRALSRGLPFQASRATPDELAPIAAGWFDAGGTTLAHRVRVELGGHHVQGAEVAWHAVTGSAEQLLDGLSRFAELGVSDLSIVPGQDDETSRRTVEALAADVVPQLP